MKNNVAKKLTSLATACMLSVFCTPAIYAAEAAPQEPGVSVEDIPYLPEISTAEYTPTSIDVSEEDGFQILKKTYLVDAGTLVEALIENGIVRRGVSYQYLEMYKEELDGSAEQKTVTQTQIITTEKKDKAAIAAEQNRTMPYNENGFSGELTLDEAGIQVEEADKQSYSFNVSDTKRYTGLTAQDPHLVPKEVQKNGVTLALSEINWIPAGLKADGSGLPAGYTAEVSYSGKSWGTKVTGYTAVLPYTGEVTRIIPGKIKYTIVYEEIKPQEVTITEEAEPKSGLAKVLLVGGVIAICGSAAIIGWDLYESKKKGEKLL